MNLRAGPNACGQYTFTFINDIERTFLLNPDPVPISASPAIEGLTLTVAAPINQCPTSTGACCNETFPTAPVCTEDVFASQCANPTQRFGGLGSTCADIDPPCDYINEIVSVVPENCIIDARMPHPPNMSFQRRGFTQMILTFLDPASSEEDSAADYQVSQNPAIPPLPPTISSVNVVGNQVTLNFSAPVHPVKWTCVTHLGSGGKRCIGYLPSDADSSAAAGHTDIVALVDNLAGHTDPPLQLHQCDIDRNNVCETADILTEIDLLNGLNGYRATNGQFLPACPSAP